MHAPLPPSPLCVVSVPPHRRPRVDRRWISRLQEFGLGLALTGFIALSFNPLSTVSADDGPWQNWAAELDSAKDRLSASQLPQLDSLIRDLQYAITDFEGYLASHGTEEVRQGWNTYLQLDQVKKLLADRPASNPGNASPGKTPDEKSDEKAATSESKAIKAWHTKLAETSEKIAFQLTRNVPGMERPEMRRLRDAARKLQFPARFESPDAQVRALGIELSQLAVEFRRDSQTVPSAQASAAASVVLNHLTASNQLPDVAQSIRQRFHYDNAYFHLNGDVIRSMLEKPVDETRPVDECILGTHLIGTSHTRGLVTSRLLPSRGSIQLELRLITQVDSRNVGYNFPIKAHTSSHSDVVTTKVIHISESGIHTDPAHSTADIHSTLHRIEHPLKIVRRIAMKKAAETKPKSEVVGRERTERKTAASFDEQVDRAMSERKPNPLGSEARVVLQRFGIAEPARQLSSFENQWLKVAASFHEANQVGAPVSAPKFIGIYKACMQMHESSVDNPASIVLAGRTVTGAQFAELLKSVNPELDLQKRVVAEPQKKDSSTGKDAAAESGENGGEVDEDENFSIEFAAFRPVIFEARDGKLRVGIRGERFISDGRELNRPLEITAVYEPVTAPEGVYLRQVGETQIDFPGRKRLTIGEVALRSTIKKKIADRFPKELLHRGWELPAALRKIGPVSIRWIDAQNGWLSVAFQ